MPVLHTLDKCSLGDNFAGPLKESKPLAACFCRVSSTTYTGKYNEKAEECSRRLERDMRLLSRWDDLFPRAGSETCLRFSASLNRENLSFLAASAASTEKSDQYTHLCIGTTSNKNARIMSNVAKLSRGTRVYRIQIFKLYNFGFKERTYHLSKIWRTEGRSVGPRQREASTATDTLTAHLHRNMILI